MNENGLSCRMLGARVVKPAMVALACILLVQWPSALAAARRITLTPRQAQFFQVWSNYLAEGPEGWTTTRTPAFTPLIRRTIWDVIRYDTAEQQIANPMIDYLLWRRSLNPARFTLNHPNLSPQLAQLLSGVQPAATVNTPTPTTPTTPVTPITPPIPQVQLPQDVVPPAVLIPPSGQTVSPQVVSPPAVPEPGTLVLATVMIGWGLWCRGRIQRNRSESCDSVSGC